jgi:hypothetical protein
MKMSTKEKMEKCKKHASRRKNLSAKGNSGNEKGEALGAESKADEVESSVGVGYENPSFENSDVYPQENSKAEGLGAAILSEIDPDRLRWFSKDFENILNNMGKSLKRVIKYEELPYISFLYNWGTLIATITNERFRLDLKLKSLQNSISALISEKRALEEALEDKEKDISKLENRIKVLEKNLSEELEVNYG